jgi:hypothetical protein
MNRKVVHQLHDELVRVAPRCFRKTRIAFVEMEMAPTIHAKGGSSATPSPKLDAHKHISFGHVLNQLVNFFRGCSAALAPQLPIQKIADVAQRNLLGFVSLSR